MSRSGPAPHSTTPASTQSPPQAHFTSQQGLLARDSQAFQDVANTPSAAGERHPHAPRSLGIRGLINPSEAQQEGSTGESSQPRTTDSQTSPYGMPPRQYSISGDRPFAFQGRSHPSSQPATPAGHPTTTPLGHTPSEHSPKSGFPFPPMGAPRQILSPREVRAASVSQASMRGPEPQQTPFLPPHAPRMKRPYPGEDGPLEPFRSASGLPFSGPPSLGPPSAGMGPLTTPPRSMSQSMVGHMQPGNPDRPQLPPMARDSHGRPQEYHGQPMLPPGQNYPPPQSPGVPVWSTPGAGTSLYQSLRSDVTKAEGGMVVRLPGDEGGILIPVDVHQASKQADEKRQRNAGASARFRQRKKERDQEQTASLQKLEQRGRDLEVRVRELTRERDFYRDERNRLRDVVLRTPLSDMANGPPSPTSSRSGGSMAETSPMAQAPMLPHQSQGYASSEASSVERPTRRRRTDSAPPPEFSMPSYGTPIPQAGNLPPMQAPAYSMMPQRPPSTAPGGERLPPLRGMEGSYPGQESGPGVSAGGPLYPSYTRVPHETGFASRSTGPPPAGHHGHHVHEAGPR
ncbi:hypothetical protein CORC01_05996 [Colletotrichum orchidophilum]|uniref:BZIP domain-containing protein n=1 Tax=Colletotrichum orchidophilum TaxID=1209926 RepID=A0A1G4BBE2_9PEZI|nr:uncharacterized protein CORC01_05996 [Colletotrichum orchidophilum]OHE98730.1 hypothetical protein CORC01_05996 [Colletotrichum orchidophilum]